MCISKSLSNFYEDNHTISPKQNRCFYIRLPYFGPYSEKLNNQLSKLFRKYSSGVDSKIMITYPFKISSLFSFKNERFIIVLNSCKSEADLRILESLYIYKINTALIKFLLQCADTLNINNKI